jgi:mannose-6-phosphate isomerase
MADIYRLYNQIKHYEWGSKSFISEFLGAGKDAGYPLELPWAEMWMGTHPGGPSRVMEELTTELHGGNTEEHGEEKNRMVPDTIRELSEVAGRLPFLFKLLAAEKPLSIQAHPNLAQAREGFARENEAGLALDDPLRNYKDPYHKPEIICALVPMTVMAGFRKAEDILVSFLQLLTMEKGKEKFTTELHGEENRGEKKWFLGVINALEKGDLSGFFMALFGLSEEGKKALNEKCLAATLGTEPGTVDMWDLTQEFAARYPDDPAILAPLFLNLFTLEPGQAVFIPAGVLHAYIGGFGVELMAASDNVLRGGLTSKFVDIPELAKILQFKPFCPEIIYPSEEAVFRYPVACDDFALYLIRGREDSDGAWLHPLTDKSVWMELGTGLQPEPGTIQQTEPCTRQPCSIQSNTHPTICIVTEGECIVEGVAFKKGESFFATDGGELHFAGNFSLYAACVP